MRTKGRYTQGLGFRLFFSLPTYIYWMDGCTDKGRLLTGTLKEHTHNEHTHTHKQTKVLFKRKKKRPVRTHEVLKERSSLPFVRSRRFVQRQICVYCPCQYVGSASGQQFHHLEIGDCARGGEDRWREKREGGREGAEEGDIENTHTGAQTYTDIHRHTDRDAHKPLIRLWLGHWSGMLLWRQILQEEKRPIIGGKETYYRRKRDLLYVLARSLVRHVALAANVLLMCCASWRQIYSRSLLTLQQVSFDTIVGLFWRQLALDLAQALFQLHALARAGEVCACGACVCRGRDGERESEREREREDLAAGRKWEKSDILIFYTHIKISSSVFISLITSSSPLCGPSARCMSVYVCVCVQGQGRVGVY